MTILGRRQFLLVLFRFDCLELGTNVVVVDFELQHLLIANRISDHVGMQLTAKHTGSRFCSQSVLWEDWCAGESELIELLELLLEIPLCLTELTAMTFVKDEDDMLAVDR